MHARQMIRQKTNCDATDLQYAYLLRDKISSLRETFYANPNNLLNIGDTPVEAPAALCGDNLRLQHTHQLQYCW